MSSITSLLGTTKLVAAALNPGVAASYILTSTTNAISKIIYLSEKKMNPARLAEIVFQPFTSLINDIWYWILYNMLSPIILIAGMLLFIAFQVGLIWLTYKVWKEIILRLIKVSSIVGDNPKVKTAFNKVKSVIVE